MPKSMSDEGRQAISSALAINAGVPQKTSDVFGLLMQNAAEVTGELQRTGPEFLGDFFAYFVASWAESRKDGKPLACASPHEGIGFDNDMHWFIGQDQVSAVDVRLALAYALKLSEGHSSRGGRYISSKAFRSALPKVLGLNNVENILPSEKHALKVRASEVEVHLADWGVIVYSRNDQLIGLNMNKLGKYRTEQEPSNRGKAILRLTREWMVERDRLANGGFEATADAGTQAPPAGTGEGVFEKAREAVREYSDGVIKRYLSEGDVGAIIGALRERFANEAGDAGQDTSSARRGVISSLDELVEGYQRLIAETARGFRERKE